MNRKFAGAVSTLTLVFSLLTLFGARIASAQGVSENRTDSSIAAAVTGEAQAVPVEHKPGGEANLIIPDLSQVSFLGGIHGRSLLMGGLVICALGLLFGLVFYGQLKRMAVHKSMLEISELIYETCKTYLITQGKFILILEVFIGFVILLYFGFLLKFEPMKVGIILLFSLVGIAGSYGVAWFGIRINTFANSRTAFASLRGKPFPCYSIPLRAGMSIGMLLISVELVIMLFILLFIPGDYAGPCFIGFAIGESLGAAALRIAGGIFTKIADIGADLMKIVFNVKEDDARNPGVIADCTGDNAGDSVGPSADGFETYGVTGVALISFIVLAVRDRVIDLVAHDRRQDHEHAHDEDPDQEVGLEVREHRERDERDQRDAGDAVRLETVRRRADGIARVVPGAVGDDARISRVVFLDVEHDLHQVGADVGDLGEDAARDAQGRGAKRFADREPDETGAGVVAGNEEQNRQHHHQLDGDEQHTDAHAGTERNCVAGIRLAA